MKCKCRLLSCVCKTKFQVKLGDFDSAGTVPGLGITEPTDQMIKFASILPLGTPGYRAPEVELIIACLCSNMTSVAIYRFPCTSLCRGHMKHYTLQLLICGPLVASA